ncbi:MAG: YcaO-like family protein [Patescibacteria group bacterium]
MGDNKMRPIVTGPHWQQGGLSVFYRHNKVVEVKAPRVLINQLVKLCDGQKTTREVIDELSANWDKTSVMELLESLRLNGVICEAVSIVKHFWPFVGNPTVFGRELSDRAILRLADKANRRNMSGPAGTEIPVRSTNLSCIIEQRISIRTFTSEMISMETIALMLWAGYGIVESPHLLNESDPQRKKVWQGQMFSRHTVPSAGALYPIRLSLILLRPTEKHQAGVYSVYFRKHGVVELSPTKVEIVQVLRSFADQTICNDAQGVIVVSGSFELSGEKYGNRSMLYVPLEAGHIAQNIHLSATENKVGTVEVGGFLEEPMKKALQLPKGFWPLTTILFGQPKASTTAKPTKGDTLDLRWAPPTVDQYELPFSMAFARPKGKVSRDWSCGRAKDPWLALKKAVSEAYEWQSCERLSEDLVRASLEELDGAIDPRSIVSYHERQYQDKHFPLKPFDGKHRYSWVKGKNILSSETAYVLADCVYFPYTPRTPRYTMANSSGTAARFDRDEAIQNATLELVERDAFMIVWLNRLQMPNIFVKSLPGFIQKRIKALEQIGFRVIIKNFTLDLAPVIFVFVQSEKLTTTICAACSSFDTLSAIDHAMEEAEAAVYCRLRNQNVESIKPREVHRTYHHGDLYGQRHYFQRANFLSENGTIMKFADVANKAPRMWNKLLECFEAASFPLLSVSLQPCNQFSDFQIPKVEKVFVPGIIPMSFGYGLEPCGMERIYTLPVKLGYRTAPLGYHGLTKFPHPYT